MARNAQDREDLIAEATALVDRIELCVPNELGDQQTTVIAGFRSNGFLSIYLGQDLHFQFDHDGCLRRAYVDPHLYRATYGNLSRLERRRSGDQVILERTELDTGEARDFLDQCRQHLKTLQSQLNSDVLTVLRFVLSHTDTRAEDLLDRLRNSLEAILNKSDDFFSRTIKGKRLK